MEKYEILKKTDLRILIVMLVMVLFIYGFYSLTLAKEKARAEIYLKGNLVKSISLEINEAKKFSIPGKEGVKILLKPSGSICFMESDCRDKVCVRAGDLSKPGQFAACLPNEIMVKIATFDEREKDDLEFAI